MSKYKAALRGEDAGGSKVRQQQERLPEPFGKKQKTKQDRRRTLEDGRGNASTLTGHFGPHAGVTRSLWAPDQQPTQTFAVR